MKKSILFVLSFTVFLNCRSGEDQCNNKNPVPGTYKNDYFEGSENILILNKNGTFQQVFRNQSGTKTNSGTWKYFKENCRIRFDSLEFLHEIPEQYEEMNIYWLPAIHRNDKILFIDHDEFSFYREN